MIKLVCPKCGSKVILTRIEEGGRWCRRCGYQGKAEEFEEHDDQTENGQ